MPKLTEDIFIVPDGEIYPRWFRAGEEVAGNVEEAARARGILAEKRKRKAMRPPENK